MGHLIKINLVEEAVNRIAQDIIQTYWNAFAYMIPEYLVQAKVINQYKCLYCTTKGGYDRQLLELEEMNLDYVLKKELLNAVKVFKEMGSEERKAYYTPLAVGLINVNEERIREYIPYLIEKEFQKSAKLIKKLEVEALVLNKIPPRYAGSRSMLIEMRRNLKDTNDITHSLVRNAIQTVIDTPRLKRQRLTDDGSTEASTVEIKHVESIKRYINRSSAFEGFSTRQSLK